jgi:citrate lyase gamma subunit
MQEKDNIALVSAISGIIGSSSGKIVLHPLDTIKARLQVTSKTEFKFGETIKSVA